MPFLAPNSILAFATGFGGEDNPTVNEDSVAVARRLLCEEIGRLVADIKAAGLVLDTGLHGPRLLAAYPGCNWSLGHIIDELVLEASRQGVVIEITRPRHRGPARCVLRAKRKIEGTKKEASLQGARRGFEVDFSRTGERPR